MTHILLINGSPSAKSKTGRLVTQVGKNLEAHGFRVERLDVRALPADDLLSVRVDHPEIAGAIAALHRADGVVVATPIYKAAYTGLLKAFLDLLPQFALAQKTVLPLATGGTVAHVLAIDYAIRPVLSALGAAHVVPGFFVLDKLFLPEGEPHLVDVETQSKIDEVVRAFAEGVSRRKFHETSVRQAISAVS